MKNGVVVINKPEGITSQTAVSRVKHLFGVKKAGHSGTLDPMATGVLPIMLGRATKASDFLMDSSKRYRAVMRLGIQTDTEDISGCILESCDDIPCEEQVLAVARRFVGRIMQTPPMYSAIKRNGQKLVDIARAGGEVEREPREITVYSLICERITDTDYALDIECSKGTYIRTVCADIGRELGCGACMASLERTGSAGFSIECAHTLAELEEMSEGERGECIISVEDALSKYEAIPLEPFFARLARNGVHIYLRKINKSLPIGAIVRLFDGDDFFALGEVREYEDGLAIKPIRQLGEE